MYITPALTILLNEDEILLACIQGKREAQEWLYHEHKNKLMGVCRRYCHSREQAQDILQDSFVKIFTNLKSYNGSGSLKGWMTRIVINTAIKNNLKWDSRKVNNEIEHYDSIEQVDFLKNLSLNELFVLIEKLPEGCKLVFNLYVVDGFTHAEIAEMLSISVGTSKSQLSRAKSLLCNYIKEIQVFELNQIKLTK